MQQNIRKYKYTQIYINIHINTHIYTNIQTYTQIYKNAAGPRGRPWAGSRRHFCIFVYIFVFLCIFVYLCVYLCIFVYILYIFYIFFLYFPISADPSWRRACEITTSFSQPAIKRYQCSHRVMQPCRR